MTTDIHDDHKPGQPLGLGCSEGLGAGADARRPMRTKPAWRYALRSAVDVVVLYCAWAIQFAASGSYAAAAITATAVGLYGMWCFYDGSA